MTDNTPPGAPERPARSCGSCSQFNYCFWAKLLVAIPVLPFVAVLAARQFINPWVQFVAAGVAVFAIIYAAKKIDTLPMFSGMVVKRK